MIYQHEARGAHKTITDAIDSHGQAERGSRFSGLMARKINNG